MKDLHSLIHTHMKRRGNYMPYNLAYFKHIFRFILKCTDRGLVIPYISMSGDIGRNRICRCFYHPSIICLLLINTSTWLFKVFICLAICLFYFKCLNLFSWIDINCIVIYSKFNVFYLPFHIYLPPIPPCFVFWSAGMHGPHQLSVSGQNSDGYVYWWLLDCFPYFNTSEKFQWTSLYMYLCTT